MRFFNTAGPIKANLHYQVPPLDRIDLGNLLRLIREQKYFVLHAPRQSGKTSALLALRDELNDSGEYRCVYVNVEVGQSAREDVEAAMRAILSSIALEADDDTLDEIWLDALATSGPHSALRKTLARWSQLEPKPIVLMIDEIDALIGDTLLAVLRQLRAGYANRPNRFPQSVILCGVRDVRDYRIHSTSEQAIVLGGSAFNISAQSLRLGDFSEQEVESLLSQHTEAAGQAFTEAAHREIWTLTQGQPWLVNALAYEACFEDSAGQDRSHPISSEAIQEAREKLIQQRVTHLDQLTHKLQEERVRRVIEPLLAGADTGESIADDDIQYVRDLGLVTAQGPIAIANPIYREVIPRDLTYTTQEMSIHQEAAWYLNAKGELIMDKLLEAFQTFFREHSEHWVERFQYKEAGPQLLLQAFLQRVVNGGGRIEREYGLGRMRTDLLIVWPIADGDAIQRAVIECKILHRSMERTEREGLEQTRAYMDRCAAAEGHLVIFDRSPDKSWADKVFCRQDTDGGEPVTIWGT
ncbi:MAG: ATP-binding protein [Gammaproteobacteria bacterium]|nr:ATP-binding protein [Gammaproteobacteria bacterium]MDE0270834.1 ATP-binding protein [Gammaproteobacteria bacterium]